MFSTVYVNPFNEHQIFLSICIAVYDFQDDAYDDGEAVHSCELWSGLVDKWGLLQMAAFNDHGV